MRCSERRSGRLRRRRRHNDTSLRCPSTRALRWPPEQRASPPLLRLPPCLPFSLSLPCPHCPPLPLVPAFYSLSSSRVPSKYALSPLRRSSTSARVSHAYSALVEEEAWPARMWARRK
jgi:hypothetical protein